MDRPLGWFDAWTSFGKRWLFFTMLTATLAASPLAHAEVLDKLELPWQPAFFLRPVLFALTCAALAFSERKPLIVFAFALAVLFTALSLWADPWFTPDIGNALQVELSAAEGQAWLFTILVQAFLPLSAALLVRLLRVRSRRAR